MNVRTLCLAILNIRNATGYEIKKLCLEGEFQHFAEVSFGSIYPALSKLEAEGLVSCHKQTQDGKPNRKNYSITTAGKAEFIKLINVLPKPDKFKSEFLLLSLNAQIAECQLLEEAISAQICQYEGEYEMIEKLIEGCDQPALVWTVNYGKATLAAKIKYLKNNRQQLLDLAKPKATAHPFTAQAAE